MNPNVATNPELTNYEMWQLERYGNILPEISIFPDGTCDNGDEEMQRNEEWVSKQSELQLFEQQANNNY